MPVLLSSNDPPVLAVATSPPSTISSPSGWRKFGLIGTSTSVAASPWLARTTRVTSRLRSATLMLTESLIAATARPTVAT
jgi:hypothetical protein